MTLFAVSALALMAALQLTSALVWQPARVTAFPNARIRGLKMSTFDSDVTVVGAGPAGTAMTHLLANKYGLKVHLLDPNIDSKWPNNYGVWLEEWESLEKTLLIPVREVLEATWPTADLYLGGTHGVPLEERTRINRGYARVDRAKLKTALNAQIDKSNRVTKLKQGVDPFSIKHTSSGTQLTTTDGTQINSRLLIDCTGFKSKLVELDGPHDPGYQIAYGLLCDVDVCPYDENSMLFMDYRTNWGATDAERHELERCPTFLYAMPLGQGEGSTRRVFFEETSLVARPAMKLEECKERLFRRLKFHGVTVLKEHEEELCVIPMGGALPKSEQRTIAFGGASNIVHAATGYMICRTLCACGQVADTIGVGLKRNLPPSDIAASAYETMWSRSNRLQRDFMVFGGDFLMKQDVQHLRGFFAGFFKLPFEQWTGFLAGWPGLPNNEAHTHWSKRLMFGINLFLRVPLAVRFELAKVAVLEGGVPFFRSVTPFFQPSNTPEFVVMPNTNSDPAAL